MAKLKRTYLNDNEENIYMLSNCLLEMLEGSRSKDNKLHPPVWEEWQERGMLTPSMKKNIKTAFTYLMKFNDELYSLVDDKAKAKMDKKKVKYDFRLIDDFTMQKLFRDVNDRFKYVVIERDKFDDILVDMCGVTCVGCTKDYKECDICRVLEESMLPYLGEQTHCPYAVDLSKYTPEEKKNLEELRARVKKNNIFFKDDVEL